MFYMVIAVLVSTIVAVSIVSVNGGDDSYSGLLVNSLLVVCIGVTICEYANPDNPVVYILAEHITLLGVAVTVVGAICGAGYLMYEYMVKKF